MKKYLACEIGASGGKTFVGKFDGKKLFINEENSFANKPVKLFDYLYWDILSLYNNILTSIKKTKYNNNNELVSIGIDTWGTDFGLVNNNDLLENPFHYRNATRSDIIKKVMENIDNNWLYQRCPIHIHPTNTLFQLISLMERKNFNINKDMSLLLIPSLLTFFLTGEKAIEFTQATTTQMYNPNLDNWDKTVLNKFKIPETLLPPIVNAGTNMGKVLDSVKKDLDINFNVILPASHDTASAVLSIPMNKKTDMFVSIGTWCCTGIILGESLNKLNSIKGQLNVEGYWNKNYLLISNITGLWIAQELLREWLPTNADLNYNKLVKLAKNAKPFKAIINVDNLEFQKPKSMEEAILKYSFPLANSGLQTKGEILRSVLESIAFKVKWTKDYFENIIQNNIECIRMVGGGIRNKLICQFISNATETQVISGPIEASAIGNIIGQMIANQDIKNLDEAHLLLNSSINFNIYEPTNHNIWRDNYQKYLKFLS